MKGNLEIQQSSSPRGFHIAVYKTKEIDANALLRAIEPAFQIKSLTEFVCKVQGTPVLAPDDAVTRASTIHPYQTSKHPTLHNHMFLVADNKDFTKQGINLVELNWDGSTNVISYEQPAHLNQGHPPQQSPYSPP